MRRHNATLLVIGSDCYDAGTIRWAEANGMWDRLRGPLGARSSKKRGRNAKLADEFPARMVTARQNAVAWAG